MNRLANIFQLMYAHYITNLVDLKKLKGQPEQGETIQEYIDRLLELYYEKNKIERFRLSSDIFENSLIVCNYKKEMYIKTFLTKDVSDLFFKIFDKTEDYHYQNQTDQPEDILEEDWNNRSKMVDELFGYGAMKEAGLVAELTPSLFNIKWDYLKKEEILKFIPNDRFRAELIAIYNIQEEYIKKHKNKEEEWYHSWRKYQKTDSFKEIYEQEINKILPNVKKINKDSFDIIINK